MKMFFRAIKSRNGSRRDRKKERKWLASDEVGYTQLAKPWTKKKGGWRNWPQGMCVSSQKVIELCMHKNASGGKAFVGRLRLLLLLLLLFPFELSVLMASTSKRARQQQPLFIRFALLVTGAPECGTISVSREAHKVNIIRTSALRYRVVCVHGLLIVTS